MSRIGKLPIPVLDKANVVIDGQIVRVDGPKGKLEKTFDNSVKIELADSEIRVSPSDNSRHARAMYGTARSIINNMVIGVVDGYEKKLEIKGVGFLAVMMGNVQPRSLANLRLPTARSNCMQGRRLHSTTGSPSIFRRRMRLARNTRIRD